MRPASPAPGSSASAQNGIEYQQSGNDPCFDEVVAVAHALQDHDNFKHLWRRRPEFLKHHDSRARLRVGERVGHD